MNTKERIKGRYNGHVTVIMQELGDNHVLSRHSQQTA